MAIKGLKIYMQAQKDKLRVKRIAAALKVKQQKNTIITVPVKTAEFQKATIDDLTHGSVYSNKPIEHHTTNISIINAVCNEMSVCIVAPVKTAPSVDSGYISDVELFSSETSQETFIVSLPGAAYSMLFPANRSIMGEHKAASAIRCPLVKSFQDPAIISSKIKASPNPGINDPAIIFTKAKADNSPCTTDPAIISYTFPTITQVENAPDPIPEFTRKHDLNEGSLKLKTMLGLITADTATPVRSRASSSSESTTLFTPSTPRTIFSSLDDSEYSQPTVNGKGYYDRTGCWVPMYAPGATSKLQQQPLLWCQACNQYGCVKDERPPQWCPACNKYGCVKDEGLD